MRRKTSAAWTRGAIGHFSRKAAKIAKTAPFTGYKTDSLRALRLGEKSYLPTPNCPSSSTGILPQRADKGGADLNHVGLFPIPVFMFS